MPTTKAARRRVNASGHGIGGGFRVQGKGYCGCGCGGRTNLAPNNNPAKGWVKGEPIRFIRYHHSRGMRPPVHRGRDNNRYNGGLCIRKNDGRALIVCRDGTHLLYSRGLMAAHIGRLLTRSEIVHHKNEDPTDDRVENYQIVTRAEHMEIHRAALLAGRGVVRHAA